MNQFKKKWIALFLAVVMAGSSGIFVGRTGIKASDQNPYAEAESAAATDETQLSAEAPSYGDASSAGNADQGAPSAAEGTADSSRTITVSDGQNANTGNTDAITGESESAGDTASNGNFTDSSSAAESTAESISSSSEGVSDETGYPAQSLVVSADDGTSFRISIPEGAYPDGIQVRITRISGSMAEQTWIP